MMNHRGYAQQGAAPAGHFIGWGELDNNTGGGSAALSGGVLANDFAVALSVGGAGGGGQLSNLIGTFSVGGNSFVLSFHVLDAGDQAGQTVTISGGSIATTLVGVYRGPTTHTNPTAGFNGSSTPSPVIVAGITKNVGALALAYFAAAPFNATITGNPGTLRAMTADSRVALADFDPASLYTNGTPEQWSYVSLANFYAPVFDLH